MALHQLPRIADYVRFLRENPQELDLLFKELLIGVTSFFRDPEAWEPCARPKPSRAAGRASRRHAARLGRRLLHRRRSLFAGHRLSSEALEKLQPRPHPASRCRSLPPISTPMPSPARARAPTRPASPPMSRPSACALLRAEEGGATGSARKSARWWSSRRRTWCRSALHQARHPDLPQPADLPRARNCRRSCCRCFTTALNPGGVLLLGSAETIGNFGRPVRAGQRQGAHLPPASTRPCREDRAGGLSLPGRSGPTRPPLPGVRRPPCGAPSASLGIAHRPPDPADLGAGGGAGQRRRRHPLHQRAHRQVPGAGRRQDQHQRPRHGPRRSAPRR
jgi:hypothetical protein